MTQLDFTQASLTIQLYLIVFKWLVIVYDIKINSYIHANNINIFPFNMRNLPYPFEKELKQ